HLRLLPDHRPQLAHGDARTMAHVPARVSRSLGGGVRTEIRGERLPVFCRKPPRGVAYPLGEPTLLLLRPRVPRFFGHRLAILQPSSSLEMIGDQRLQYPAEVARAGLGIDEDDVRGRECEATKQALFYLLKSSKSLIESMGVDRRCSFYCPLNICS